MLCIIQMCEFCTLLTSSELKTRFGRAAGKSTMPQLAQIKAYHREHPEAQGST